MSKKVLKALFMIKLFSTILKLILLQISLLFSHQLIFN